MNARGKGRLGYRSTRPRAITKAGKPVYSEDHEHIIVADWLRAHRIMFIHSPNGMRTSWKQAKKAKRMGMLAGVSDFLIFTPPPFGLIKVGAVLELKALDGNNPTPAQLAFLAAMENLSWATTWCKGAETAILWLREYCGYGR